MPGARPLSAADVVAHVVASLRHSFPKRCGCGRRYENLYEYAQRTKPLWPSISLDENAGDPGPAGRPATLMMARCACGNTLGLLTENMPAEVSLEIQAWLRREAAARQIDVPAVIDDLRQRTRDQWAAEAAAVSAAMPIPGTDAAAASD